MTSADRLLLGVDEGLSSVLVRAALGYFVVPLWSYATGVSTPDWTLLPFFLGVLVASRLVPGVLRKVVKFPEAVCAVWTERRQLAKRFDSFQWQKLLGIGVGLLLYAVVTSNRSPVLFGLAGACLATGAGALVIWRREAAAHAVKLGAPRPAAAVRTS